MYRIEVGSVSRNTSDKQPTTSKLPFCAILGTSSSYIHNSSSSSLAIVRRHSMGIILSTISQAFPPKPTFTEKDIGNLSGKVILLQATSRNDFTGAGPKY